VVEDAVRTGRDDAEVVGRPGWSPVRAADSRAGADDVADSLVLEP